MDELKQLTNPEESKSLPPSGKKATRWQYRLYYLWKTLFFLLLITFLGGAAIFTLGKAYDQMRGLREREQEVKFKEMRIDELTTQLQALQAQRNRLLPEKAGLTLEVEELNKQRTDLDSTVKMYSRLKSDIEYFEGRVERAKSVSATLEQKESSLNAQIQDLENQVSTQEALVTKRVAEAQSRNTSLVKLNQIIKASEENAGSLETQVEDLRHQLKLSSDEKTSLETRIEPFRKDIETLGKVHAERTANLKSMEAQLRSTEDSIVEVKGEMATVNTELSLLQQQKAETKTTVLMLENQVKGLEQTKQSLMAANSELEKSTAENETLIAEIKQLVKERKNLGDDITSEKMELEELTQKAEKLKPRRAEVIEFEKRLAVLTEQEKNMSATISELDKMKADLDVLKKGLYSLESKVQDSTGQTINTEGDVQ